jgi:hypothetical protein
VVVVVLLLLLLLLLVVVVVVVRCSSLASGCQARRLVHCVAGCVLLNVCETTWRCGLWRVRLRVTVHIVSGVSRMW